MGNLNQFFRDLGRNAYGLGENVASLGSAAIAEPVAGFAAMYDPTNGAAAIREGMTYTPRTQAGQMYQQGAARTLGAIAQPAMPIIDAWKQGVDIAGRYSPAAGAMLRTVPAAIGVAMGAKPALQAGRQVSNSLGAMQARMVANANAPRTLNTGFRGQRGTFAGINALTADRQALAKAQEMIARGDFPDDVWQETGWGQGADGKWRFEIDDSSAQFTNDAIKELRNKNGKSQGAIFPHQDLAAAYPESADIWTVKQFGNNAAYRSGQMGKTDMISLGIPKRGTPDLPELKRTNLHELQHAIQEREGFASGGNMNDFLTSKDPFEEYRRVAGEVESRAVERRADLNPQQRRDNYPFEYGDYGYDVVPEHQNLQFEQNISKSQRPLTEFEQAHLLAQQRAALPVNQMGLDLPANNTAMDRARAMGWDTDVYHGSAFDIENIDTSRSPFYTTEGGAPHEIEFANNFANTKSEMGSPKVYPLLLKKGQITDTRKGIPEGLQNAAEDSYAPLNIGEKGLPTWGNVNSWARRAKANGEKGVLLDERPYLNSVAVLEPSMVRSRFAAFDPFNRDSSNLLAQSAKLAPTTALGAYMYNEKRKKSQGKQ